MIWKAAAHVTADLNSVLVHCKAWKEKKRQNALEAKL